MPTTLTFATVLQTRRPTPTWPCPLAYGIVRNNIYRVRIKSITRTPDNFNITLQIRVVPWQRYEHGEVIM